MKENQIRDINTAMYESTKLLQSAGRKPRYASIIIDEGQDFSDNAYRLIRALAGEEHPNDIFIVGDSHQRIYRNHPTLSKCGINVRGRSSILKINYRTTEEIRKPQPSGKNKAGAKIGSSKPQIFFLQMSGSLSDYGSRSFKNARSFGSCSRP